MGTGNNLHSMLDVVTTGMGPPIRGVSADALRQAPIMKLRNKNLLLPLWFLSSTLVEAHSLSRLQNLVSSTTFGHRITT